MRKSPDLNLGEGTMWIGGESYWESLDAFHLASLKLTDLGYALEQHIESEEPNYHGVAKLPETPAPPSWQARLHTKSYLKCHDCGGYLSAYYFHAEGRTCHHCGEPLWRDMRHNFTFVWIQEGIEYPDEQSLPLPSNFYVYETWRWAPLPSTPSLYRRVLSTVGLSIRLDQAHWYEGKELLTSEALTELGRFVRHFTELDADEWDRLSPSFPRHGIEALVAVARFCHPDPSFS